MGKVAVTQEDVAVVNAIVGMRWPGFYAGYSDAVAEVIATHRIATAEACARIAEGKNDGMTTTHTKIATAIRLQQGSEKP